ncbi:MAG: Gfo/Idh/MocA family oxidoreductase [Anaerolineales bacterium]|nr:Gfo/Idh/MocA family oxidoreductase [Anaerolineales bacterium]
MSTVRWGLLSTANINRAVIPAIRASARGILTAVASRSLENAQAYAQEWEIPQAFGGYQEMLDSGEVDAVYIGLPNHLHAEWSIKAMQAGVHVLCEKPFALTLAEVDAVTAASEETGMHIAEAFMYRHHPQTKLVGEWVQNGLLGEITLVQAMFDFRIQDPHNVRLVPEWGGGCLWDVGVYPMSLAQYVMGGPPEWVIGDQWLGEQGVDMSFTGQMHYANGAVAQISASFQTPFRTEAKIIGTKGYLALTQPFVARGGGGRKMTFQPAEGDAQEIDIPEEYLYQGEVEDMQNAILDGTPNYLTLTETRNHIKTILALYQSAQTGQIVHLG